MRDRELHQDKTILLIVKTIVVLFFLNFSLTIIVFYEIYISFFSFIIIFDTQLEVVQFF